MDLRSGEDRSCGSYSNHRGRTISQGRQGEEKGTSTLTGPLIAPGEKSLGDCDRKCSRCPCRKESILLPSIRGGKEITKVVSCGNRFGGSAEKENGKGLRILEEEIRKRRQRARNVCREKLLRRPH